MPVRAPKSAEFVAGEIRRQIAQKLLVFGDSLPHEAELVQQLGVSRPTLREALRVLEAEGLVRVRRGSRGGATILGPSDEVAARLAGLVLQGRGTTSADVFTARLVLKPAGAALAAERDCSSLRRLLEDERAQFANPLAYARVAAGFHTAVLELAGSTTVGLLARMLHDILRATHERVWMQPAEGETADELIAEAHRSHQRLVELIEAGDAATARNHWEHHLEVSRDRLLGDDGTTVVELLANPW